jgi:hypothetical protein
MLARICNPCPYGFSADYLQVAAVYVCLQIIGTNDFGAGLPAGGPSKWHGLQIRASDLSGSMILAPITNRRQRENYICEICGKNYSQ